VLLLLLLLSAMSSLWAPSPCYFRTALHAAQPSELHLLLLLNVIPCRPLTHVCLHLHLLLLLPHLLRRLQTSP
jgi:hypothetical protein